jgi:hypothetical protein
LVHRHFLKPRNVTSHFNTMLQKTFFLALCICNFTLFGQKCVDKQLSNNFTFATEIVTKNQKELAPCKIIVKITDKKTGKKIQSFEINSEFILASKSFKNCNSNKSFITGKNQNMKAVENDYGDIIVADFNFDNKEDFAVKREEGGNGGPLYNFYIQTNDRKFVLENYLSNTMLWFPFEIDKAEMTLATYVRSNSSEDEKVVYKYDVEKREWKIVRRQKYRNE